MSDRLFGSLSRETGGVPASSDLSHKFCKQIIGQMKYQTFLSLWVTATYLCFALILSFMINKNNR